MDNWIKCSDQLPPDCQHVLVYCDSLGSMTAAYLAYSITGMPLLYFIIDFDEHDQTARQDEITHWMELPEKPKVKI